METRVLGRTGLEVGVIGLGVEHINVSRENMDTVFDLGVSAGLNYVDLLFTDPDEGSADHWATMSPALRRHRGSLVLALHWGLSHHEPVDLCERRFDSCLDLLGNGHAEIGMITMVDSERAWNGWAKESLERLKIYQQDGRIGWIGLSNHDPDVARIAIESGLIDVLMFPVNLYQHPRNKAHASLLETCANHGVGVVAMKPYYGGKLIEIEGRPTAITPLQCIHYVLSQPVAVALPGPQNADHLRDALAYNTATAEQKQCGSLTEDLESELQGQCTECQHCLPCPEEIRIPTVVVNVNYLDYYSGTRMSEDFNRQMYASMAVGASACTECGVCEDRCPFDVKIIGKMRRAVELFETEGGRARDSPL